MGCSTDYDSFVVGTSSSTGAAAGSSSSAATGGGPAASSATAGGAGGTGAGGAGGHGGDVPEPTCSLWTFTDEFADKPITPPWYAYDSTALATVKEAGGKLTLTLPPDYQGAYAGIYTEDHYDFTECAAVVKLDPLPPGSGAYFGLIQSAPDVVTIFEVFQGVITATINDGSGPLSETLSYDGTKLVWLRIRENGGTTKLETSPDGKLWGAVQSLPSPSFESDVYVDIAAWEPVSASDTGTVKFDDFNHPP